MLLADSYTYLQYIFIKLRLSNGNTMDLSYNDVKCGVLVEMLHEIGLALKKCQANRVTSFFLHLTSL